MLHDIHLIVLTLISLVGCLSPLAIHLHKHSIKQRAEKNKLKDHSSQEGQPESNKINRRSKMFRLVMGVLSYGFGVSTLLMLARSNAPLTTGDAAMIMLCLLFCLPVALLPPPKG